MRRLLFFIVITAMGMFKGHSQTLVQTYTDRCTGATQVFTVPMNGSTVVAFYNRSRTFTSQDFQNGTLQAWLEETYLWWTSLSPCSTTTAGTTATQQTTQQTTQQATQAATNAAQTATTNPTTNAPPSSTSPPSTSQTSNPPPADNNTASSNTSSQGQSTGGTDNSSTGGTDTGSGSTETSSSETQSGSSESGSSSSETSESSGSSESSSESKTEETKTEETKSEEKTEEVKEEKKEETKEESKEEKSDEKESDESTEEDSEEKSDEEESNDEESEEEKEEDSEEESNDEDKEEDDEDEKKKRALAPPVVMANMLSQQGPDGTYTQAAMFGVSQSSLLGTETYGLNAMVYSNLQQFMLTANYSKVHIKIPNVSELNHDTHKHFKEGKEVDSDDPQTPPQPRVNRVYSGSIGVMKMFTTYMAMMNHSMVWMGEKGSVKGLAFGTTLTSVELDVREGLVYYDNIILGTSLTGFYTKPFNYNRWNIAPMLAVSSPFWAFDLFEHTHIWNTDVMIIGGSNFTFSLTQRFGVNFGINIIESTIKDFPTLKTFTIGGRLSF